MANPQKGALIARTPIGAFRWGRFLVAIREAPSDGFLSLVSIARVLEVLPFLHLFCIL